MGVVDKKVLVEAGQSFGFDNDFEAAMADDDSNLDNDSDSGSDRAHSTGSELGPGLEPDIDSESELDSCTELAPEIDSAVPVLDSIAGSHTADYGTAVLDRIDDLDSALDTADFDSGIVESGEIADREIVRRLVGHSVDDGHLERP